jgi:hypothetical protein
MIQDLMDKPPDNFVPLTLSDKRVYFAPAASDLSGAQVSNLVPFLPCLALCLYVSFIPKISDLA